MQHMAHRCGCPVANKLCCSQEDFQAARGASHHPSQAQSQLHTAVGTAAGTVIGRLSAEHFETD